VLPIVQGPGKGLKWIVGSYNHGCWLGSYEFEKQVVLPSLVSEGDVVYDIGAHVGYFTIICSRLVGPSGQVIAFEPLAENYKFLLKHVELNKQKNVIAINAGVSTMSGEVSFDLGWHSATGSVGKGQSQPDRVQVHNLIDCINENSLKIPNLIKMDIEGAELEVIPSILDFLVANRVKLLLSTHGDLITKTLVDLLKGKSYRVTPLQWSNRPDEFRLENATLLSAVL
jgi:FkbM family methyltransferase